MLLKGFKINYDNTTYSLKLGERGKLSNREVETVTRVNQILFFETKNVIMVFFEEKDTTQYYNLDTANTYELWRYKEAPE